MIARPSLVLALALAASPALAAEGGDREPAGGAMNSSIKPQTSPGARPSSAAVDASGRTPPAQTSAPEPTGPRKDEPKRQ
jgi:hypothetical protein